MGGRADARSQDGARGGVLVFYPADLQYKPEDIPRLVAPILAGNSDIVTGYKEGKYEKAFVSGIYNRLSRSLFKINRSPFSPNGRVDIPSFPESG